ncbi:MAG: hypothetical protein GY816_05230 [Cytophagales bacterium]|nr:hypothetical protein [Cytophagales bacterium]
MPLAANIKTTDEASPILQEEMAENLLTISKNNSPEFNITKRPSGKGGFEKIKIYLEGRLTVEHVDDISKDISDSFDTYQSIAIILRNVHEIDLAIIQLLFFLKTAAIKADKHVVNLFDINELEIDNIKKCGFGGMFLKSTQ